MSTRIMCVSMSFTTGVKKAWNRFMCPVILPGLTEKRGILKRRRNERQACQHTHTHRSCWDCGIKNVKTIFPKSFRKHKENNLISYRKL